MNNLKKIVLENFKCFEGIELKTSKITLLTGANSSGKSSILYSILGSIQSNEFPLHFSPNGKYIRMGDFHDIVFNHNDSLDIKIEFEIDNNRVITIWNDEKDSQLPILKRLEWYGIYYSLKIWKVRKYHLDFSYDFSKDPQNEILNQELIKKIFNSFNETFSELKSEFSDTKKPTTKKQSNNLEIDIDRFSEIKENIHFTFQNLTDLPKKIRTEGNFTLQQVFDGMIRKFNSFEKKINFISSFRLYPERTYYEKSEKNLKVGRFGEGYQDQIILWETEKKPELKKLVEIMKNLSLFDEIKTKRIGGGRYEIKIKNKKDGILASLNDVGFGISQFLPIITADLQLGDNSTLFIAQPEIHLHPKVQAQFGDYIVERTNKNNKNYIIETHSEYLLNRIRLNIAKGNIDENDVAIYYLENNGKKAINYKLKFKKNGVIEGAPNGFFDTYMIDVMNIALES